MGEAKRRGTFNERRQQAIAKRADLFAARSPKPERPVVAIPRRNMQAAVVMMAALAAARRQGVFIVRRQRPA